MAAGLVFNARDYSASRTRMTDDTAAINLALTDAKAANCFNGTLLPKAYWRLPNLQFYDK